MNLSIEIGIGEAFDRLTILEIKMKKISDAEKLKNINVEYDYLNNKTVDLISKNSDKVKPNIFRILELSKELSEVNEKLWHIEDALRECEKEKKFDERFIELARSVYFTNDQRAKLKKEINNSFGSKFVEEKSYSEY
jgi:predicted  nucleic acid-binding Zn-ribbon protein